MTPGKCTKACALRGFWYARVTMFTWATCYCALYHPPRALVMEDSKCGLTCTNGLCTNGQCTITHDSPRLPCGGWDGDEHVIGWKYISVYVTSKYVP